MQTLLSPQPTASTETALPAVLSPKGWDQIEDQTEVERVLDHLRATKRYDVYQCAELYELAYPGYQGDLDYYLDKAKTGRALYLGVGAGRIFAPLAQENPEAIGVELSPQMLDLLRGRHPQIAAEQVLRADAVTMELPEARFDTVVAPYSFLQVVEEPKLPQLLENVRRWLRPGGSFYTDTFSPYLIPFAKKGLEANVRRIGADTRIAVYILYDHLRQSMTEMALVCHKGEEKLLEMPLHYYFPHEIAAAFHAAGFDSVRITGGYQGEPFDPSENEVTVYEARRAEEATIPQVAADGNGRRVASPRSTKA